MIPALNSQDDIKKGICWIGYLLICHKDMGIAGEVKPTYTLIVELRARPSRAMLME